MFKAAKFIKICIAVMLFFLINYGDSGANKDCDEGYDNSGPTIPADYTPLPNPGPATMVVVNIGDEFIVWNPDQNRYASILSADASQYITFPCSRAELQRWFDSTSPMNSNNLFSSALAGEVLDYRINPCDYGTCGSCSSSDAEASALTSCGTQLTNAYTYSATVCEYDTGAGDDISADAKSEVVMEAKQNELFHSHRINILNSGGSGGACARTKKVINETAKTEFRSTIDENIGWHDLQSDAVYTIYTPLGVMASDISLQKKYFFDGINLEKNSSYEEYIATDGRSMLGLYTDTVMVQIYIYQYCAANRHRPCAYYYGWMPGSVECDWEQPVIEDRVLHIQAQLNVFPNADAVNPTLLSRNGSFEQALVTLLDKYNSINGVDDKEIGATAFSVNFRQ